MTANLAQSLTDTEWALGVAKRSRQMITSEPIFPACHPQSELPSHAGSKAGAADPGSSDTSKHPGEEKRDHLFPRFHLRSQEILHRGAQWSLTSQQPGLGHVLAPKSIMAKGHLRISRARPRSGGGCWGTTSGASSTVTCRQTSTWLPMTPSSPTPGCNSLSLSVGRTVTDF